MIQMSVTLELIDLHVFHVIQNVLLIFVPRHLRKLFLNISLLHSRKSTSPFSLLRTLDIDTIVKRVHKVGVALPIAGSVSSVRHVGGGSGSGGGGGGCGGGKEWRSIRRERLKFSC